MCELAIIEVMIIKMKNSHNLSLNQVREFLKVNAIQFKSVSRKERYCWVDEVLTKFRYFSLRKKDKGIVRDYILRLTGMSKSQTDRLVNRKRKHGKVFLKETKRNRFPRKYNPVDIALLIKTDNSHQRVSGQATKSILGRESKIFKKEEYENISEISVAHIYNLRETRQYKSHSLTVKKTNSVKTPIGERRKPEPYGKPGYLRVDSVHQGDLEKKKGVYHINIVDEVTQWEVVGCVEKISERFLEPLLLDLIEQLPFRIINFHSDNGSEYINKTVASLLKKLLIRQTKSRARKTNDNALVEGKNASVIRKHIGHLHIPANLAPIINQFYKEYFNEYLAYHRPCGFATIITDKRGKEKKIYGQENYKTPYEKLKSLRNAKQYLKKNESFKRLDKVAYRMSDNDFAEEMEKYKQKLFKNIKHKPQEMVSFTTFISASFVD